MVKGRPRAVQRGGLGQNLSVSSTSSLNIPSGPVYYPNEDEFKDPLEFIRKIRAEAEPYGICKIVPPKNWKPPFALNMDSFTFPTKTQAIHQLQERAPACDSKTFELEYNKFLEKHFGKKLRRKVVFEEEDLDLCKLFNAVKRYGGYDKVVKEKKWGEVSKFVRPEEKISECAKHVLSQLYREHLFDYEEYHKQLNQGVAQSCKRGMHDKRRNDEKVEQSSSKRRRRYKGGEKIKVCEAEEEHDQMCIQCRSGLHGELMLLCDRCNKGWHIYCLSPPLKQIPPGNWYCLDCVNSDEDSFGFIPGKRYSLEAFRRIADRAKKKWFGSGSVLRVQIEKKFWEIVEGSIGEVEVMYGSDLDTSLYGSGFPRTNDQRPDQLEAKVWDEYCKSPWNLNNLPKLKGSVLQAVHNNITGVMVPWLYIGMLFSSFCWHFEDHCFYSMNYLHWGEPKCWYSVPGSESGAFEKVMRKCLPDLFDAQPDLLFHLITMLNPSVLQENGVSVYSVLQEPGNFVITFPRSYHGGFNLGLNCAEAVNFAPADWLPHGGFGAELYKLYHKPAVLSHEELLCVIAKSDPDSRVSPYLKKELIRIYKREKTWREKLWRNGIVKSTQMSPRKCPEYVGTEEDPACIICRQYLYISAVVCRCRPLTFVCLEHWKHLCECKSSKLRLLYRHSLAEFNDLVLSLDKYCSDGTAQRRDARQQMYCSDEPKTLTKKDGICFIKHATLQETDRMSQVKNGHTTLAQLAEKWLVRSSKILQNAFSKDSYVAILKKAEQFLWAGSEMDPVREMAKNVIKAQKWAESIRDCLSKVENWSCDRGDGSEKVCMEYITKLLLIDPVPCNEPGHLKLKDYAKEAMVLIREIDTALSAYYKVFLHEISDLELLHSKVGNLPIYVKESEKLIQRISSSKMCMESVRKCISEKGPAAVELEFLNKLKSEILELQIQFPEVDMLLDLLRQAELFRSQCCEILKGPITLKSAKELLQKMDDCTVNVPELRLLRQYHTDAVLWISRFNDVLHNIHERHDQHSVVDELNCILEVGASLRIQVDELPLVRIEIKNACCRKKALKARDSRVSMDCLQQLIVEAKELGIESENLFVEMSQVLVSAVQWEEKAKDILGQEAEVFEFEDLIRSSDEIFVILPSLDSVKLALSTAISWLKNSELFLTSCSQLLPVSSSLLKLESLKELVSQSKLLKVSLKERRLLETVLRNCEEWEHGACSLLQDIWCLLNMTQNGDGVISGVISEIEHLVTRIESTKNTGLSLGFDLNEIPKLEDACNTLQWCRKALFFCSVLPPYKDVENLVLAAEHLPGAFVSSVLCSSLINGVKWLKQASEVLFGPWTFKRFKLSDVEEVLTTYKLQCIAISFPVMVGQLEIAIQKHKLWQDQVHQFFSLELRQRSWTSIMMLKEVGTAVAFDCSERDSVFSEVEKVEKWKQHCINIMGTSVGAQTSLLRELQKIRDTLDRSLYMYHLLSGSKKRDLCLCCFNDSPAEKLIICASCKDCYHLQCLGLSAVEKNEAYECSYCLFLKGGSTSQNGSGPLKFGGNCPELKLLVELLSYEDKFSVCVEEQEILNQVVEKALSCRSRLAEIVNSVQGYFDEDLSMIHTTLTTALKASDVAGIYDDHWTSCELKLALARSSWKVCVKRLLEGLQKPAISQIQQHFKEGVALNIPPEDHYRQQITAVKHVGLQWSEYAKKVAADSGALSLDKVFELIKEGENLPVCVEKELELLRARSMLYCICRKPYDQRAMIACDQCDEWYHFDCIKLIFTPKVYICPACEPQNEDCLTSSLVDHERLTDATSVEPKTPSPQHAKSRKSTKKIDSSLTHETLPIAEGNSTLKSSSGIERLWWRNRKPFRRAAKKREELDSLSPFFHLHN